MTIENLGVKLYTGTKSDRVSASLGSSANGTNSNITLDTTNEKLGTGCYSFNGSSSKVTGWTLGTQPTVWTLAFWFRADSVTNYEGILNSNAHNSGDGFRLELDGNNDLRFLWNGTTGATHVVSTNITQGQWYHLVIQGNQTTNKIISYLDGVASSETSFSDWSDGASTFNNFEFGLGYSTSSERWFTGLIDDFGFWSRAITSLEVSALAAGALVSSLTNKSELKANYTMDSTSISSTLDITSNSGFTANVTGITTDSNGKITNAGTGCTANTGVWKSLGFTLGSTWCCIYRYKRIGGGSPNDNWAIPISFTSSGTNASGNSSTSNDAVGHYGDTNINAFYKDGASGASATSTGEGATLNTYYYIKMIRTTSTNLQFKIYNNSDFSDTPTTSNKTISGISDDLTYLFAGAGVNNNTWGFEVDQIKIFNNATDNQGCANDASTTSALEVLTGTRTNSIFQQTDDTPSYWWYNGTSWVLDGTTQKSVGMTASDWSFVGKQSSDQTQSIDNGVKWVSSASQSGGAPVAVYDFGAALSDTWVARFSWHGTGSYSTEGGNAYIAVALSSQGTYGSSTSMNSALSGSDKSVFNLWHLGNSSSDRNLRVKRYNSGFAEGSSSGANTVAWEDDTTMYFEMSYDGTTLSCRRKTDSTYSTNHADVTPTLTNTGLTGLRYLVFGGTDTSPSGVFTITLKDFSLLEGRTTWL